MSYLRKDHAPLHGELACALYDAGFKGSFVLEEMTKDICGSMDPARYVFLKSLHSQRLLKAVKACTNMICIFLLMLRLLP